MRVLAFVNQKGGCGKTTAAVNLAGALAARGERVLLVDLDPQAHATLALGCAPEDEPSLLEVLTGEQPAERALVAVAGGYRLLPATARLSEYEELAARAIEPGRALRRALAPLAPAFDRVLLDCPPRADGVLTANALAACDVAVLVVEMGAFALQGALRALDLLAATDPDGGPRELRVLATLFDRRTRLARELLVALQARFGPALYETAIRTSVRLREAAAAGVPVQVLDPGSRAALDFAALAAEVCADRGELEARGEAPRAGASAPR
jgi:chromosome partitioning protein